MVLVPLVVHIRLHTVVRGMPCGGKLKIDKLIFLSMSVWFYYYFMFYCLHKYTNLLNVLKLLFLNIVIVKYASEQFNF